METKSLNGIFAPLVCSTLLTCLIISCGGSGSTPALTPIPTPASLSGIPLLSICESKHYYFSVQASNFDEQSIQYSIINLPAWADFDESSGILSGTPSYNDAAVYANIIITASDNINQVSLDSFSIDEVNVYALSGKVIDGYISGAFVYIDVNNNKQQSLLTCGLCFHIFNLFA